MRPEHIYDHFFFMPEEVQIIGRLFELEGDNHILAALTRDSEITTVWVISESEPDDEKWPKTMTELPKTQREEMHRHAGVLNRKPGILIESFDFNGRVFRVGRSSSGRLNYHQPKDYTKLQYFLDKGLELDMLKTIEHDKLTLSSYELYELDEFDMNQVEFYGALTIKSRDSHTSFGTEHKLKLPIGMYEEAIMVELVQPNTHEIYPCYINGIELYDLWAEKRDEVTSPKPDEMSQEMYEQWRVQMEEVSERLCPKDKVLAIVHYEADDCVSVQFQVTEILDQLIDRSPTNSSGAVSSAFVFSNQDLGLNGMKLKTYMLLPVDEGFNEAINVEVLRWSEQTPGKTYRID